MAVVHRLTVLKKPIGSVVLRRRDSVMIAPTSDPASVRGYGPEELFVR